MGPHPATLLSALLLVAFGLLVVSVISTPIVRAITIATVDGVQYGVFGYCKGSSCSAIHIGYLSSELGVAPHGCGHAADCWQTRATRRLSRVSSISRRMYAIPFRRYSLCILLLRFSVLCAC